MKFSAVKRVRLEDTAVLVLSPPNLIKGRFSLKLKKKLRILVKKLSRRQPERMDKRWRERVFNNLPSIIE